MARRRNRNGQQSWHVWFKLFKLAMLLAMVGAAAFYAYQVGHRLAMEEVDGLKSEIARLAEAESSRRKEAETLAADLAETRKRADEFESKYNQVAPSEEMRDLMGLVRGKLASGLEPKRLAFVISQAERPRRCTDTSTKRFMVKTAKFKGDSTWVRFADLITVTADGQGEGDGSGQAFDPDKPVTVKFTAIGGKEAEVTGKLPLQHSMVVKSGEYRFTIAPGAKGFVEVTGDRCEYRG